MEYSGKVQLQEVSALEPLLKLLKVAEDADVLLHSLTAVRLMVEHYECQIRFIELQGITIILSWLNSEYRELQKLALETLECLMRNKECRCSLQEADGLAKITEFISKQVSYCLVVCVAVYLNSVRNMVTFMLKLWQCWLIVYRIMII